MNTPFNKYTKFFTTCTLVLMMWLSGVNVANASHIVGGEITYQWVSGYLYEVKLSFYRDCSGILPAPTYTIDYSSALCGLTGSIVVSQVGSPEQVSPLCAGQFSNSSCNGGTLYGVEKITYSGTVVLSGNCSDWLFEFNDCCRNAAISNIGAASAYGSYFSARLNNLDVPFNNSVAFGNIPYSVISNNSTSQLSWNSYDVDGDSLVYELVPARDFISGNPFNLTYLPGYTYAQPFMASLPTVLNYANGLLTVTPNQAQVAVVCMKVSEYRNGFLVGEVYRDYQVVVDNGLNSAPTLSGMNGFANNYVTNGCPGDSITFYVNSSDPDSGQNVILAMNNPGTTAVLNATTGTYPVGVFTWVPTIGDISASAYTFIITANDDHCPYYGTYSQAYQVYVNGCNTNDVWPGDANADGVANLYDLLPIGIAYNETDSVRPFATNNWNAQPCPDWTNEFISGINHKHADTDGNGTINISDTTAIYQNYGLNHPLRLFNPGVATVADLSVETVVDTVGLMTTVHFDITFDTPVDSIYGLAFRLYLDPAMIDLNSIAVTYPGSVFGTNGVDMINLDQHIGMNGFVDIALTRINQVNISGTGPVARVTIVTTDNVSGKVSLVVEPFDITGITINESVVPLNGIGAQVVIDPNFVGVHELNLEQQVQVYPSPATDLIHFNFSGSEHVDYIKLYDVAGKEVMQMTNPGSKSTIDLKGLSKGTYQLKTGIGHSTVHKKIMIF